MLAITVKERNFRVFQQSVRPQQVIIKQITQEVFHRASGLPELASYMTNIDYYLT